MERRYQVGHDGPAEVVCRVCYARVVLEGEQIFRAGEYDDAYWAFRCPECGGSFPVREDDAPAAPAAEA